MIIIGVKHDVKRLIGGTSRQFKDKLLKYNIQTTYDVYNIEGDLKCLTPWECWLHVCIENCSLS